jgi:hypothetical protein
MQPVESSLVAAVGYDRARRELHVRLVEEGLYVYSGVPASVFMALLAAESKGACFNRMVKAAGYPYEKRP